MFARHKKLVALAALILLYMSTRAPLCLFSHDRHYVFHGRIVDQTGTPVSDALVQTRTHKDGIPPFNLLIGILLYQTWPTDTSTTHSDRHGDFSTCGCGQSLRLKISKAGYVIRPIWILNTHAEGSADERANEVMRHSDMFFVESEAQDGSVPGREMKLSEDQPLLIPAWKRGESAENLLGPGDGSQTGPYMLKSDGRLYTVDMHASQEQFLQLGDQLPGDVRVAVVRDWQGDWHDVPEEFHWSLKLTAIDGGLIETQDPLLFQAPKTGYKPSIQVDVSSGFRSGNRARRKFYLRSRGGSQYASLVVTITPVMGEGQSELLIAWRANPDGTGNLLPQRGPYEFDPAIYPR